MRRTGGYGCWAGPACLIAGLLSGCGPPPQPAIAAAPLAFEPGDDVSDDDVRRALEAGPRLPQRVRVAMFINDDTYAAALERALVALPQISGVYRIPPLLASGRRRFDQPQAGPINVRKLRLIAARARADVVLIADYGHETTYRANGLAVFGVALLPLFVLPIQDVEARSYVDGYLFDTRNGYLYGQLSSLLRDTDPFVTIYSSAGEGLLAAQRQRLIAVTSRTLSDLIASQQAASQRYEWPPGPAGAAALPTDTEDPWAQPNVAKVSLTVAGDIQLDGQPVADLAGLVHPMEDLIKQGPVVVTIHADERVSYSQVVALVDRIKRLGIAKVSFSVVAPPPQPLPPEPLSPKPKAPPQLPSSPVDPFQDPIGL
jgi:hypothetical protein